MYLRMRSCSTSSAPITQAASTTSVSAATFASQSPKEEFKDHYGGYKEWLAAENDPHELRTDTEGGTYTKQEFVDHYGGTTEWDSGKILDTAF